MYKCWEDYVDKRLIKEKSTLPFPYLVTKLVLNKGVEMEDRHYVANAFPVFTVKDWHRVSLT
jgi:hypothetical protein